MPHLMGGNTMAEPQLVTSGDLQYKPRYRLLIAVFTCPKYADRATAVRDTWLSGALPPDVLAFFVMGRPGHPPGLEGDTLYLDCPEAYERLPVKTWKLLEYCLAAYDFEHLLKCDDDSYISRSLMYSYPLKGKDYIGKFYGHLSRDWHFGKCEDASLHVAYRGVQPDYKWAAGAGYFLSAAAAAHVIAEVSLASAYEELYEDVMVGVALRPNNFSGVPDPFVVDDLRPDVGRSIIHPILPRKMRKTHTRRTLWHAFLSKFGWRL